MPVFKTHTDDPETVPLWKAIIMIPMHIMGALVMFFGKD